MARLGTFCAVTFIVVAAVTNACACGPFYEAPSPTLDYYLKQLPGKSFGEILGQKQTMAQPLDMDQAARDLANKFTQVSAAARVKLVDDYLVKARNGKSSDTDLNLLENLRDAAASGASNFELQEYVSWRQQNDPWFVDGNSNANNIKVLKDKLAGASPALKPCWLYLMGAVYFRGGDMDNAEKYFDQIFADYKSAPVAETALFMKARCAFTRARSDTPQKTDAATAHDLFQQYVISYPKGRFIADAWGWLGGLESDDALALVDFARQAENTDHPEVFASAESEVSRIFGDLDYSEGDKGFDEVAQHPELAMALAYVAVQTVTTPLPEDDFHSPPSSEDQAKLEKWRATILPKLAAAVAAHKDLYHGAQDESLYLTILAHAASDNGDNDKALQLLGMVRSNQSASDDLLFVKGLVLQRSGKSGAAVPFYRSLIDTYPKSELTPGTRYRLALALHDLKKDGDALLELAELTNRKLPIYYPTGEMGVVLPAASTNLYRPIGNDDFYSVRRLSGVNGSQIEQTVQTILNFAPVESLEQLLQTTDADHEIFRQQVREIVVARYLAQNDFSAAARIAQDPAQQKEYAEKATLTGILSSARDVAGAMSLADYWASHRFKLTWVPLQAQVNSADFKPENSDEDRRVKNGITLQYPAQEVNETLDSLDELSHAITWWRKAEELDPQGSSAPQALWKIIDARRSIAETSPYALQRAIDTDKAKSVRHDYDRLIQNFPNSVEASRYGVYWTFPKPTDLDSAYFRYELSQRYPNYDSALNHYGHPAWYVALHIPFEDDESAQQDSWKAICNQVYDLPINNSAASQADFAKSVEDLRKVAGPLAVTLNRALLINCLDDLGDLATVPNLDPAVRTEYAKARINLLIKKVNEPYSEQWDLTNKTVYTLASDPGNNPQLKPISDFVDALVMASAANDFSQLFVLADTFLKKYPTSPKRELAAFYQIRGALGLFVVAPNDTTKSHALDAAFAAYAKEFPVGKLTRGVRWMHGLASTKRQDWAAAAADFTFLLNQNEAPELKPDSAYQLATIFDNLNDSSFRHDVLGAVKSKPEVCDKLRTYIDCGEAPFLKDYLLTAGIGAQSH